MNEDILTMIDRLSKSTTKRALVDLAKDQEATDYDKNMKAIIYLYYILENKKGEQKNDRQRQKRL